jgi:quercetin dioxygenase-like cupin family protein
MSDNANDTPQAAAHLPPDDLQRQLTVARPLEDQALPHVGIVGDTYTILLSGKDTAGRYCLIDMHVPPGGGSAPHRHDFEESFTVLEGEIQVTFRDTTLVLHRGETANVPANAPHHFHNGSDQPTRLLCIASPAGIDEFFLALGVPVADRTTPPPPMDAAAQAAFLQKAASLSAQYSTELLPPA